MRRAADYCDVKYPARCGEKRLRALIAAELTADGWRTFCDFQRVDPDTIEIYEHWVVSSWLAGRLEERGEAVSRDFFGLTVWGRATTGQAISIDGVIREIVTECWEIESDGKY
jgi:hypothetical protein